MITACRAQLRVGMGGPFGLDFSAVLKLAEALEVDTTLLASVLPSIEAAILSGIHHDEGEDDDG